MTFEEWIQNWRDVQPSGKLDYNTEEGAREAWDYMEAKVERLEAENKRIKDGWDSVDTANKKINARLRDTLAKVERLEKLEAAVKDAHGWIKRDERRYQITIAVDLWNALEAALEGELDGR